MSEQNEYRKKDDAKMKKEEWKKRLMILCVAGQSNAVGYDESVINEDYLEQFNRDRIWQLGLYGEDNLKLIPLDACAQNYQDLRPFSNPDNYAPNLGTKGIHLPLANELLYLIPKYYDIVVVPCAYGGTGFTVNEFGSYDEEGKKPEEGILRWGVESPYYKGIKDRISFLLDANEFNMFLGMIWIQGEHDNENPEGQIAGFEEMAADFLKYFKENYADRVYLGDWNRNIWFNIETVSYWYTMEGCRKIWENYRNWNKRTYVEIPRSVDSNEVNGTGITAAIRGAHFGNNAFVKEIAPRILEKMKEVRGWNSVFVIDPDWEEDSEDDMSEE